MWNKIKQYLPAYIIGIAIPLTVGILAAALTRDSMDIYGTLVTPPLAPPAILFPIVWSILYVLMGISSAGVYTNRELNPEAARKGLEYYAISLALNFLWSIIFFGLSAALPAFICLLFLLYYIIRTILEYKKVKSWCAYLQIPYAVWVAFAGYLNAGIWLLNQ
ncbi:MAG: tryptophan-rich sensory protein [Ruminococcaceae bacterium]|nr:tryptophan-rich sensory protein [Oscillospiraceae bacterium]